jgi:putative phage-type endonuclease
MAPLTQQQLELRRQGIGSSDIAAICGLSRWASPIDVFLDKVNGTRLIENTIPLRMGHALEPLIAELYAERTTHHLDICNTIVHPTRSWQLATPDRLAVIGKVGSQMLKVVECKKAWSSDGWGEEGTDQVPQDYLVQTQWQMDVAGLDEADIAVLMGHRFAIYCVRRDDELCEQLRVAAESFWIHNVLAKQPPPIDGSEGMKRYLSEKYGTPDKVMLESDDGVSQLAVQLARVKEEIETLTSKEELLKNRLRDFIGDSYGVQGDCWKATWGKCKDGKKVDWEAVAKELGAAPEVISRHTKTKPGHRTLRFTWKDGDE